MIEQQVRAGVDGARADGGQVRVDRLAGRVALVTIANPRVRNALSMTMWQRLRDVILDLDADPDIGAMVIAGEGDHFSAGADIRDLPDDPAEFHARHLAAEAAIADSLTPVVAAIRGSCVGGGCEIAVAADVRFADASAQFGVTASRLGIVYPWAPTQRLVETIGISQTRRLLIGSELFDVGWALRVGLVAEVVADEGVIERSLRFARLAARRSPTSVRGAQLVTRNMDPGVVPDYDYREGRAAFVAGRTPEFRRPAAATPSPQTLAPSKDRS